MINIQKEIVDWLKTLKGWQTELAFRILTQEEITDVDISDFISMIKNNVQFTNKEFPNFVTAVDGGNQVRLKSIESISNIESLAPRNPLKFEDLKNLIVIYGSNGSGKSGYTKIIKKASGKPRASELKANVFKNNNLPSKCTIRYLFNDVEHSQDWEIHNAAIKDLSQIDVFDTKTGEGYLKEANVVAHIPVCVALFEALSHYYNTISQKLDHEKMNLVKNLSSLPINIATTKSGLLYNKINKNSTEATLSYILNWNENDDESKKSIENRLKEKDPIKVAVEKRSFKLEIDKIIREIITALKLTNSDAKLEIIGLKTDAIEKRKAVIDGAQILSGKSKVDGVGSLVWRSLWEAAKTFSLQEAYKNLEYPNIEEQSRCVLCHQLLDEEAKARLLSFENFVKGQLENDATQAEIKYTERTKILPIALNKDTISSKCRASNLDDEWIEKLLKIWNYFSNVSDAIKKNENNVDDKTELVNAIIKDLKITSDQLEKDAIQLDADAKQFDRVQAEKDLLEITAKKWCSEQKIHILEEIERQKKVAQYDDLISQTNTKSITLKANNISEIVISNEYVTRFDKELSFLGANQIRVELYTEKGAKGVIKHSIRLKGVHDIKLADVLSEGEFKIISLAAFLADVTGGNNNNPFVFDDPISSLDQIYEEKMVERLIELSQTRQVIVFTHRLSLLGQLNEICDPNNIQIVGIRHEQWGAGEIGDTQLFAKKTDKALNNIKNDKISKAKKIYIEQGYDEYYPYGKMLCSDIRIIIERIVEFDFLADVIQRYRRAVNTKNKVDKLAKIKKEDCDLINDFMTRYSYFEHSQPGETPVEIPEPNCIEVDLDKLLTWLKEFNNRQC